MATLADTLASVRASSTRVDSLIADRAGLKTRVEELLAQQGTIPAEVQSGLDEIFDIETAEAAKIDVALNNGPSGPLPAPPTA